MEEGVSAVRPAGAVWSSAQDMSKYLLVELAEGRLPSGVELLSRAALLSRRRPQVKITDEMSYGLGLFVENEHGTTLFGHGGNNLGFTSDMLFLPTEQVGMVVLTNGGNANAFRAVLSRKLLELVFDGKNLSADKLRYATTVRAKALEQINHKLIASADATWAAPFAKRYHNQALGEVSIHTDGKIALFDAGEWKSEIKQLREADGTLKLSLTDPPWAGGIELVPKASSGHMSLILDAGQEKYVFEEL